MEQNKKMHKCLLKNRFYEDRSDKCIPLDIEGKPILACKFLDMFDPTEIDKLNEYADKVFAKVDDNRRKKIAYLRNKKAAKKACKRLGKLITKGFTHGNVKYEMDDYCDTVEIIRWVKERYVSGISFRDLTGSSYESTPEFMYMTIVIGLEPPSSVTKMIYKDGDTDAFTEIKICSRISVMYCESYLELRESYSIIDHTQIFFHVRYKAQVSEIK